MNLSQDEEIYIFNIERMIQNESIKAIKNKITGIYETNIKTFDKNIVFISISKAKSLLELNDNRVNKLPPIRMNKFSGFFFVMNRNIIIRVSTHYI